ncbi:hypothetical protein D1Z90_03275 [Motilimonas pumila]|uniref:Uncharacterized protein n=1 Tax=Motilimonas pumila TaxID=2303987 RepID=A0A418YIP1_9GAMM|nr:hypothetical protein D1Z90_03275 [Motilimonas pumila]
MEYAQRKYKKINQIRSIKFLTDIFSQVRNKRSKFYKDLAKCEGYFTLSLQREKFTSNGQDQYTRGTTFICSANPP